MAGWPPGGRGGRICSFAFYFRAGRELARAPVAGGFRASRGCSAGLCYFPMEAPPWPRAARSPHPQRCPGTPSEHTCAPRAQPSLTRILLTQELCEWSSPGPPRHHPVLPGAAPGCDQCAGLGEGRWGRAAFPRLGWGTVLAPWPPDPQRAKGACGLGTDPAVMLAHPGAARAGSVPSLCCWRAGSRGGACSPCS